MSIISFSWIPTNRRLIDRVDDISGSDRIRHWKKMMSLHRLLIVQFILMHKWKLSSRSFWENVSSTYCKILWNLIVKERIRIKWGELTTTWHSWTMSSARRSSRSPASIVRSDVENGMIFLISSTPVNTDVSRFFLVGRCVTSFLLIRDCYAKLKFDNVRGRRHFLDDDIIRVTEVMIVKRRAQVMNTTRSERTWLRLFSSEVHVCISKCDPFYGWRLLFDLLFWFSTFIFDAFDAVLNSSLAPLSCSRRRIVKNENSR